MYAFQSSIPPSMHPCMTHMLFSISILISAVTYIYIYVYMYLSISLSHSLSLSVWSIYRSMHLCICLFVCLFLPIYRSYFPIIYRWVPAGSHGPGRQLCAQDAYIQQVQTFRQLEDMCSECRSMILMPRNTCSCQPLNWTACGLQAE